MSIRIIKPGRSNWENTYHATCYTCDAEFMCGRKDGIYVSSDNLVRINCPNCQHECIAYPDNNKKLRDFYS
jgi:hypothetical protein